MRLLVVLALATTSALAQHEHQSGGVDPARLGTVAFDNSCSPAVQATFNRAVALLHSFEFGQAIDGFRETLKADPTCGIAYWGIALSQWGNPFAPRQVAPDVLRSGLASIARARTAGLKTEREQRYAAAVEVLFAHYQSKDQHLRVAAYEQAMRDLAAKYPKDSEAAIFHALALAASAPLEDKTYAKQLEAGRVLETLFAAQPDHPGLAHYIIHSYDVPPLASRALPAARRYAQIAPGAPHALHMPSHTFTRLGLWQESIDTNIASAETARRQRTTSEELHAMDYLMYAYLQAAQDGAARQVLDRLAVVLSRGGSGSVESAAPAQAGAFAVAAIPARYALERQRWNEAAVLVPRAGYPFTEAITHFARALGAARSGDVRSARQSIDALERLRGQLANNHDPYWAEQVAIQEKSAQAWVELKEGRAGEALVAMQQAANMEDATEKSAVTPGPLVPARELLGEMLLQVNQAAEAERAFAATLRKEPGRFRAVYGAARAARMAGHDAVARSHYQELLRICERADQPGRPELAEAREFVNLAAQEATAHARDGHCEGNKGVRSGSDAR